MPRCAGEERRLDPWRARGFHRADLTLSPWTRSVSSRSVSCSCRASAIPLHIFEPRYRELIGECLDDEREFGLVLADDDGMREIGTTAAVVEVIERFDDGRLNIVVEGRERFQAARETDGRSFLTAQVAPVDRRGRGADARVERCLAAYRRVAAEARGRARGARSCDTEPRVLDRARVDFGPRSSRSCSSSAPSASGSSKLAALLDRAKEAIRWTRMPASARRGTAASSRPGKGRREATRTATGGRTPPRSRRFIEARRASIRRP